IPDALEQAGIIPGNLAEDRQLAGTGLKLASDDLDEGALAGAIGANEAGQASTDFEADVVQPHDHAVPPAQLLGLDDGVHAKWRVKWVKRLTELNVAYSGLTRLATMIAARAAIKSKPSKAPQIGGLVRAAVVSARILRSMLPKIGMLSWAILRSSPSRKTARASWSRSKLKLRCLSQGFV